MITLTRDGENSSHLNFTDRITIIFYKDCSLIGYLPTVLKIKLVSNKEQKNALHASRHWFQLWEIL